MAEKINGISNFKYDFKNRKIKEINIVKRNDELAIYQIIFGEEMPKISKTDLILEKLNKMDSRLDKMEVEINNRFNNLETKIDNLTEAVIELQSEAKNHG